MSVEQTLQSVLTDPQVLAVWAALVLVSLVALAYDLRTNNAGIAPLMKFVWGLTVLYSGPVEHRTRLAVASGLPLGRALLLRLWCGRGYRRHRRPARAGRSRGHRYGRAAGR